MTLKRYIIRILLLLRPLHSLTYRQKGNVLYHNGSYTIFILLLVTHFSNQQNKQPIEYPKIQKYHTNCHQFSTNISVDFGKQSSLVGPNVSIVSLSRSLDLISILLKALFTNLKRTKVFHKEVQFNKKTADTESTFLYSQFFQSIPQKRQDLSRRMILRLQNPFKCIVVRSTRRNIIMDFMINEVRFYSEGNNQQPSSVQYSDKQYKTFTFSLYY